MLWVCPTRITAWASRSTAPTSPTSARALDRLFANARMQDARAKQVFDQAHTLYGTVQDDLMKQPHPEAFKVVETQRAGLEHLSGYPALMRDLPAEGTWLSRSRHQGLPVFDDLRR